MAQIKFHKQIFAVFFLMFTSRLLPGFANRGFVSCVQAQTGTKNTLLVVEFSRHGARAPTNIDYAAKLAKDGKQPFTESRELTEEGLRQHFEMGKQLIRKFHLDDENLDKSDPLYYKNRNFMTKTYDPEKIYVQSTDVDRTYQSAMAQLVGTFGLHNSVEQE